MLPNSFLKGDAAPSTSSTSMKMEHDGLYWGQQQVDSLGQNVYPVQSAEAGLPFQYRNDSSSSSSSTQLQAIRDFMSQGGSGGMAMYPQQLVTPPPFLVQTGEDTTQFRSALPDAGIRGQYFGCEKTPHRTQFQRESHILAERQRREEMNDKFASLRAMLPKSSKKDKASIVGDTINYVMELEKTLKQLQTKKAKRKGAERMSSEQKKDAPTISDHPKAESKSKIPAQVEVQALGEQAVVKLVCSKSPKLVLKIVTALEKCKVEVLQSNVTTLGDTAVHFFTLELTPGLSVTTEELIAALEAAATSS